MHRDLATFTEKVEEIPKYLGINAKGDWIKFKVAAF